MDLPVLIGPTASGKTELALALSKKMEIEIVLADSRKVYRYLDIGTAKPTYGQRQEARFHMFDLKDPDEYFSAGDYGETAEKVIEVILKRSRIPLIVGGSGLYIETIFNPLPPLPKPDPVLRQEVDNLERKFGLDYLYKRLKKEDPSWASRIDPNDRQRIKRGLEVIWATGRAMSELLKKRPKPRFRPIFFGISLPRSILKERIERRVERMLNDGLIEETEWLLSVGYDVNINALKTIGYQEVIEFLNNDFSKTDLRQKIYKNTYTLARRQTTWFRR
ncbi:MAG TPA: tRNA (adenosine(37)-N6)-dimethylallyltransferase MiaA, partial [bacterium (Candidatus Stahlbacteria)]|nr:tRNA (adenosine(37)-N6)-dimethylallyltransferase MiaA [Candidatus Stahlbacteria bacterium]